jgi:hypothetical protein
VSTSRAEPALSVLMVAGQRRERAQRVLDAVAAQSRADALEMVVVDLAADTTPLRLPAGLPTRVVALPAATSWGPARARAFRESGAPLVAFIEDHCYPAPGWAEALLEAHRQPWDAVGYAFTNPYPDHYVSRAAMMFDYGLWAHPAKGGPSPLLSYNNVSYKREALLLLGDERLDALLATDFHVHQELLRRGRTLGVAAAALAAHENFTDFGDLMAANHHYTRALAAGRVKVQGWGRARRIFYGLATPFGAPLITLHRRLRSLRGRPSLWGQFAAVLPAVVVVSIWTAVGEALGYLLGAGSSQRLTSHFEIHARRRQVS